MVSGTPVFDPAGDRGAATSVVPAAGCDPDKLWRLLATPEQWRHWAPHITRTTAHSRAGDAPVRPGDRLRIDSFGPAHVTAVITRVEPGRRWDFRVALPFGHHVESSHEVLTDPTAVRLHMTLDGVAGRIAGHLLLAGYQPLARLALRRLVSLARATSA